jgi:DNA primase
MFLSFISSQDPSSFELAVKEAKPMMEYYFNKVISGLDLSLVENKKEVAKKMLAMIAKLANKIEAAYWLKTVAQALEIDENALRESLPKETDKETVTAAKTPQAAVKSREEQLGELLLAIIIRFPDFASYVISKLELNWLENEEIRSFYKNLIIYYNKTSALDYSGFKEYLASENGKAADILDRLVLLGEKDFYSYEAKNVQEEIIKIIIELKKYYLQKRISTAQKAMAEAEKNGETENINKILEELKVLMDSQRNNQIS